MRYLLCFIFPPLAVLACKKPGQAILNLVLTCCLWLPGTLHALFVVSDTNANERTRLLVSAINPQQPQVIAPRQPATAHKGRLVLIILSAFFGLGLLGHFLPAEKPQRPTTVSYLDVRHEDLSHGNRLAPEGGHSADAISLPTTVLTDAQIRAQNAVALSHLKTANHDTNGPTIKALRLWKNARLDIWEKYYGKPETITSGKEADGFNTLNDTPASYRWQIERLDLTVAFTYHDGNELKIDVEAREGKNPLTLPEAQTFASALGLPGPIHASRNPTAADALENNWQTWCSGDLVGYFNDTYPEATSFYFENSHR
jgi:uncharacterized membrane protein YqaE (UPF0057 family)